MSFMSAFKRDEIKANLCHMIAEASFVKNSLLAIGHVCAIKLRFHSKFVFSNLKEYVYYWCSAGGHLLGVS